MSELMTSGDEVVCGGCGATSKWDETYYQDRTPDSPGAALPQAGYISSSGWERRERYRVFCPKCGAMLADEENDQLNWVRGARPVTPGKSPVRGGRWIPAIIDFVPYLVPQGSDTLDIEGYRRADAALRAKAEARKQASIPELIDRLRNSKGTRADHIELELKNRGEEAVPFLIEALKDPEVYLRWRTCYVLASLGKRAIAARPALEEASQDGAESVQRGAREALFRMEE